MDGGSGANIWHYDLESLNLWNKADDESGRDSASSGIIQFSPIDLPSMDSSLKISVPTLSDAYDFIFGSHDAAAFIRREEEKLVESGSRAEDEGSKLSRRANQQKSAIEKIQTKSCNHSGAGETIQKTGNTLIR